MEIQKLRGYGIAPSDAEASWSKDFKSMIEKKAKSVVINNLSLLQKIRVLFLFEKEKKRAIHLDLSDLEKRGMRNNTFIKQQLEYLSLFSALKKVLDEDTALKIMYEVMDATAREAFLLLLPDTEELKNSGEPFEVFRKFFRVQPDACRNAGCLEMKITEDTSEILQFDIYWCAWLVLANRMGVPEACIPNCYADDLVYPEYFNSLGIKYSRSGTLAKGNSCCDFRFEKI